MANSLGAEDMVLTDVIATAKPAHRDLLAGHRPPALETYDLMAKVQQHYGLKLKFFYPQHEAVEAFTREHGINAFYDSVELRKACCHARKVEPSAARWPASRPGSPACAPAIHHPHRPAQAPVRRGQRPDQVQPAGRLDREGSLGLHPPEQGALQRPARQVLPQHRLRPCTRPVSIGEDVRAGRWWWEIRKPRNAACTSRSDAHRRTSHE
jgi:phosphoadenosine phosphosulfate reductase